MNWWALCSYSMNSIKPSGRKIKAWKTSFPFNTDITYCNLISAAPESSEYTPTSPCVSNSFFRSPHFQMDCTFYNAAESEKSFFTEAYYVIPPVQWCFFICFLCSFPLIIPCEQCIVCVSFSFLEVMFHSGLVYILYLLVNACMLLEIAWTGTLLVWMYEFPWHL